MTMAITKNEWKGESAKFSIDSQGKIVRTYTHKRRVESLQEGFCWDVAQALAYSPGQAHSSDTRAKLLGMSIDSTETLAPCKAWDLTLDYTTDCPSTFNNSEDPLQARPKRSWQTTEQTLYTIRDRNGDLIANKAGQPFDGGIPVSIELPTLVVERNEADFDGAMMAVWANSLNQDYYSGAEPETLKMKISATEHFEGDYYYWAVRYELVYFPLGWQPQPCNAGLYQLIDNKLVRCKDKDLQDVQAPVPLDNAGKQIKVDQLPGAANYIKVDYFNRKYYASLAL